MDPDREVVVSVLVFCTVVGVGAAASVAPAIRGVAPFVVAGVVLAALVSPYVSDIRLSPAGVGVLLTALGLYWGLLRDGGVEFWGLLVLLGIGMVLEDLYRRRSA